MMSRVVLFLIRVYQRTLGAVLGGQCRFYPSCSNYCHEAVTVHGVWRGLALGLWRVLKCHPFHPGGVDPVPRKTGSGALTHA
jgi:putative membrane protein insertion efficiency factor